MTKPLNDRHGFAWLELLLALAAVALVFQLFPSLLSLIDPRNWTRVAWFAANVAVVFVLVGVRFGPDWVEDWRERQERLAKEHTKAEKIKKLKEQHETIERMKTSRRRRIY